MHVKEMEISAISKHVRSGFCVKRVNAPVPGYSDESDHTTPAHFTMFCLND